MTKTTKEPIIRRSESRVAIFLICALLSLSYTTHANNAQEALWSSFELSKKIKIIGEFELCTYDYLKNLERFSAGIRLQYKINDWLKDNAGYVRVLP